jgi:HD superfamily phosphohydrolase
MTHDYQQTVAEEINRQVVFLRKRTLPEKHQDFFRLVNGYTDWLDPGNVNHCSLGTALYFRDPLYGSVCLDEQLSEFYLHPVVQRLNEIKQLGFAFSNFPSATHTRLAHSIGVSYLAGQVMRRVLYSGIVYTPEGKKDITLDPKKIKKLIFKASLCGLLHDISHCAFGHAVDRLLAGLVKGKRKGDGASEPKAFDKRMFGRILESHFKPLIEPHFRTEDIIQIVTGQTDQLDGKADKWDTFISQLINSDADVDRIDFLQRDAFFTAEPSGALNVPALIDAIRPWEYQGRIYMTFSEDFISLIEDLVLARDLMYLRCYDSPAKLVGEWMATKSMNIVMRTIPELKERLETFTLLTDAQIPELLCSSPAELAAAGAILQSARCSGALAFQEVASAPLSKGVFLEGGVLAPLFDYWLGNEPHLIEAVHFAETTLAGRAGCSPGDILLTLPASNATEIRDANIYLLRKVKTNEYCVLPLTGWGNGGKAGEAAEYPSALLKPILIVEEDSGEKRRVTLSSFAVMERARLRLFAAVSRMDKGQIAVLQDEFKKLCSKGERLKQT